MNEALRLLGKEHRGYYLESVDLGSEFATRGGRSTVSATVVQLEQRLMRALGRTFSRTQAQYTWRLSRYCFVFAAGAPFGCAP
jgi:hypothetical protein